MGIDPWVWFKSFDIDVNDGPYAWKQEGLYLFLDTSVTNTKVWLTSIIIKVTEVVNTTFIKVGLQLLNIQSSEPVIEGIVH